MTNTPDTSPEAVERLREIADYAETDTSKAIWDYAEAIRGAADQIEALSAALETEKRHKLAITGDKINAVSELRQVKAERDALKAHNRYWSGEYDVVLAGRADEHARAEAAEAERDARGAELVEAASYAAREIQDYIDDDTGIGPIEDARDTLRAALRALEQGEG